jgi:hypothetical protein
MSPEVFYWLTIAVKMAIGASVVIAATVAAERAGPLIGALVATLPVSAGPSYFFLAFEQDAAFFSQSALGSLLLNASTAIYATTYVLLSQRNPFITCVPAATMTWLGSFFLFSRFIQSGVAAALLNIIVFGICFYLVRRYRDVRMPKIELRWYDFAFRAGLVGTLIGIILLLHTIMGPLVTGALAAFPIVFTSMMLILHQRYGGPACAAVMANGITGLIGFGIAAYVLHVSAIPLGVSLALTIALCITVAWNLGVFALRGKLRA